MLWHRDPQGSPDQTVPLVLVIAEQRLFEFSDAAGGYRLESHNLI